MKINRKIMKKIKNKDKCCSTCRYFENETIYGDGWCTVYDWIIKCDKLCYEYEEEEDTLKSKKNL